MADTHLSSLTSKTRLFYNTPPPTDPNATQPITGEFFIDNQNNLLAVLLSVSTLMTKSLFS